MFTGLEKAHKTISKALKLMASESRDKVLKIGTITSFLKLLAYQNQLKNIVENHKDPKTISSNLQSNDTWSQPEDPSISDGLFHLGYIKNALW